MLVLLLLRLLLPLDESLPDSLFEDVLSSEPYDTWYGAFFFCEYFILNLSIKTILVNEKKKLAIFIKYE